MSRWIASAGGLGFAPAAPGTVGSAAALVAGALLLRAGGLPLLLAAALLATLGGWWATRRAVTDPNADPGWVVIDEVAGQWTAMLAVPALPPPAQWPWLLAAFALFRLFDIAKPGPVGWADRQGGAWGIMADDVIAGAGAALLLLLARLGLPALWG